MPNQTLVCADLIHLQELIKKLDEVTQNSEIVEIRQKESECELEAARDRVQQQATEILLKASKILLSSGLLEMCTATTVNTRARSTERVCAALASWQHSVSFHHRRLNMRKLNNGIPLFFPSGLTF